MNTINLNQIDKVIVRKGGGGGAESTIEYLDVSGVEDGRAYLFMYAIGVKGYVSTFDSIIVGATPYTFVSLLDGNTDDVTAIALSMQWSIKQQGVTTTVKNALNQSGWTEDKLAALPRLTKEQFYNTES